VKGLLPLGWRGGSGKAAITSSVSGSSMRSRGPSSPTQIVTMRPRLSKVCDPHSALWKLETRCMLRPSGPDQLFVSDW
jgi:hypothetical protein